MTQDSQKPDSKPGKKQAGEATPPAPGANGSKLVDETSAPPPSQSQTTPDGQPAAPKAPAKPAPGASPAAAAQPANGKSAAKTGAKPAAEPTKPTSAAAKPAAGAVKERATRPPEPIDPAQAHVLVVEDNVPNFVLIARLLAYMGVQRCEWKTSGWQVVEFADTLPRIDLILMDIRLPYEDGFQALERVRASSRLKDTLVVAVTAEASVEQMKRAQECGFDGFLGKPLDPDRFPEQIRRILRGDPVWEVH